MPSVVATEVRQTLSRLRQYATRQDVEYLAQTLAVRKGLFMPLDELQDNIMEAMQPLYGDLILEDLDWTHCQKVFLAALRAS